MELQDIPQSVTMCIFSPAISFYFHTHMPAVIFPSEPVTAKHESFGRMSGRLRCVTSPPTHLHTYTRFSFCVLIFFALRAHFPFILFHFFFVFFFACPGRFYFTVK